MIMIMVMIMIMIMIMVMVMVMVMIMNIMLGYRGDGLLGRQLRTHDVEVNSRRGQTSVVAEVSSRRCIVYTL